MVKHIKSVLTSALYWAWSGIGLLITACSGVWFFLPVWMGFMLWFSCLYKKTLENWSEDDENY